MVNTLGDLRVTMEAFPPGHSPRPSRSSSMSCAVKLQSDGVGPSHKGPMSFSVLSEDQMSIAASESGLLSSGVEEEAELSPFELLMPSQIQS